jgi:hypothetical protein
VRTLREELAAQLCSTVRRVRADRIDLRTAGVIFGWLVGVAAFALAFSVWLTIALAMISLAAAMIWSSRRRGRASAWAIAGVMTVGTVTYLAFSFGPLASDTVESTAADARWVPVALGLDARLEAKNNTYGNRWATKLEADGNDDLQFKLVIRNTGSIASPEMIARLFASGPESHSRMVAMQFGSSEYGPFSPGPEVQVIPQSNGLYRFNGDELVLGAPSPEATPLESLGGWVPRSEENDSGFEWRVPSIPAHGEITIGFLASYWTPESSNLDGASLDVKNVTRGEADYSTAIAAAPGDELSVGAVLHNSGFRSLGVFGRVDFGIRDHGRFDLITIYATESLGRERELGQGLVNSSTGQPIALQIRQGTTQLITPKTHCSKEAHSPLPDGVAVGGIDLGSIGGFRPRDPCSGVEFTRMLEFKVDVRKLRRTGGQKAKGGART